MTSLHSVPAGIGPVVRRFGLSSLRLARLGIMVARQVPAALHPTGTDAAYPATKARRGGHDLLSRGLERAAQPHRNAGPIAGPAHLGIADG